MMTGLKPTPPLTMATGGWLRGAQVSNYVPKMFTTTDRKTQVHRNLLLLVLFQGLLALYISYPYYISPYIHQADYSSAQNYTLRLPNASYVTKQLPWLSAPYLPRVLSQQDHDACMEILAVADRIFTEYDVPFVLAYGSLIGSYTMHDMLPWDDDIDMLVSWTKYKRFRQLLTEALPRHGLGFQEHDMHRVLTVKLFFVNGSGAGLQSWTWPYIDIAFFEENATHVWNQNAQNYGDMVIPREWFFPLTRRPFGSLWILAPYNTANFLRARYGSLKCIQFGFNHKNEFPRWAIAYAPCETLEKFYAFVWRKPIKGGVKETLRLGEQEIYSVIIDYSLDGETSYFF